VSTLALPVHGWVSMADEKRIEGQGGPQEWSSPVPIFLPRRSVWNVALMVVSELSALRDWSTPVEIRQEGQVVGGCSSEWRSRHEIFEALLAEGGGLPRPRNYNRIRGSDARPQRAEARPPTKLGRCDRLGCVN
jgi:hypothetical protein